MLGELSRLLRCENTHHGTVCRKYEGRRRCQGSACSHRRIEGLKQTKVLSKVVELPPAWFGSATQTFPLTGEEVNLEDLWMLPCLVLISCWVASAYTSRSRILRRLGGGGGVSVTVFFTDVEAGGEAGQVDRAAAPPEGPHDSDPQEQRALPGRVGRRRVPRHVAIVLVDCLLSPQQLFGWRVGWQSVEGPTFCTPKGQRDWLSWACSTDGGCDGSANCR